MIGLIVKLIALAWALVFWAIIGTLVLLFGSVADGQEHYTSPRGPSWPNCPVLPKLDELPAEMRKDPERYEYSAYLYGSTQQPKRCMEVIDKQQKSATGRKCRVALRCDS